jgi:hypothetical protein
MQEFVEQDDGAAGLEHTRGFAQAALRFRHHGDDEM